jgi:hypothetical protein
MRLTQFHGPKFIPHLTCIVATIWNLPGPPETTPGLPTDQKVGPVTRRSSSELTDTTLVDATIDMPPLMNPLLFVRTGSRLIQWLGSGGREGLRAPRA